MARVGLFKTRVGRFALPLVFALGAGIASAQDANTLTQLPAGAPHEALPTTVDLGKFGYASDEFLFSGTARAYTAEGPLGVEGNWVTAPDASAPYTARFFVRRPTDPAEFNGTVHVEWLNVTPGVDNAPAFKYGHVELLRSGTAYIAVAAQAAGAKSAEEANPERYEPLDHPGDSFSYDIFAQAAEVIRANADTILPGLEIKQVIASGVSQSATRLTTYLNGVHAHHPEAYDGVILYSSFSWPAALSQDPLPDQVPFFPAKIRDNLDIPVLKLETEMELQAVIRGLPIFPARPEGAGDPLTDSRQPDTEMFRLWEVPGATHVGAYYYTFGAVDDGSDAVVVDMAKSLVQPTASKGSWSAPCAAPINPDLNNWVYGSSIRHMNAWVSTGTPPPSAARIASAEINGKMMIARDDLGNAMGGLRTPYVDAPVASLNGWGQGEGWCFLNGAATPISETTFKVRYKDADGFVKAWTSATEKAVADGFIVEEDKARLLAVGETVADIPVSEWKTRPAE